MYLNFRPSPALTSSPRLLLLILTLTPISDITPDPHVIWLTENAYERRGASRVRVEAMELGRLDSVGSCVKQSLMCGPSCHVLNSVRPRSRAHLPSTFSLVVHP